MEKKQTAVEWLAERCGLQALEDVIAEAKQMEKEQIQDAWNGGDYAYFYSKETGRDFADGEQYYNETFGGQDNE
jgi:hypothetical protein